MHCNFGRQIVFLLTVIIVMVFCVGCDTDYTKLVYGFEDEYTEIVADSQNRDIAIMNNHNKLNYYDVLEKGATIIAYKAQIIELLNSNPEYHFHKDALATLVIAVDRDVSDSQIDSFESLLHSELSVSLTNNNIDRRAAYAGLAYSLSQNHHYNERLADKYLAELNHQGRLNLDDFNADAIICFDFEAVELIEAGRNLELYIPKEGTISLIMGYISNWAYPDFTEDAIANANLRSINGKTYNPHYPDLSAYANSSLIEDYQSFNDIGIRATRNINRNVLKHHIFLAADGFESVIFASALIVVTLIWMVSAVYRSSRVELKHAIYAETIVIILWLLARILRHNLSDNILSRYLWYSYFIFMLALPIILLYVTTILEHHHAQGRMPRWLKIVILIFILIVIFLFTNDFHQLIFRFDINGDWSNDYQYGWGFIIIFAAFMALFISSLTILIIKSRRSPQRQSFIIPIIFAVILISYYLAYVFDVAFIRDTDVTFILCAATVIFLESVIHVGIIPSNTHYNELFKLSPFNIQILDKEGRTFLSSNKSTELRAIERMELISNPGHTFFHDQNTLIHSHEIHGGLVVWQEDITTLNELNKKIATSIADIENANNLLMKDNEIKKHKLTLDIKTRLFTSLENDIKDMRDEFESIVNNLNDENREIQTAYIALLLCHLKRRCNIFFLAQENKNLSSNELSVYLDELSEFANYAHTNALVRIAKFNYIDIKFASIIYDFYFYLLAWSINKSHATLVGQLTIVDDYLEFNFLSSEKPVGIDYPKTFKDKITKFNFAIIAKQLEDGDEIKLIKDLKEADIHE